MARIKLLRQRLNWSQKRMAVHLGCAQSTVARMELGQGEPGPVSKLLDLLDAAHPVSPPAATVGEGAGAAPGDAPSRAAPADRHEVAA